MKNLFWILIIISNALIAQEREIDSLKRLVSGRGLELKDRVDSHLELCKYYYQLNLDSMTSHANKALDLSLQIEYTSGIAESYKFLGIADWRVGDNAAALLNYNKSLSVYESSNDFSGISKMLGNLSSLYRRMGKYDSAIHFQRSSIKIKKALNDDRGMAISLLNLAQIFDTIGLLDSAQAAYNKAFPIIEKLNSPELELKLYLDQSYLYDEQGETEKAIAYMKHAIDLGRKENILVHLADATNNLAEIYIKIKDYDQAIELLEESIRISEEINNPQPKAIAESNLGIIYIELGQLRMAKVKLRDSYEVFKEFGFTPNIAVAEVNLARIATIEGRNDDAVELLMHALSMTNELNDYDKSVQIIESLIAIYDKKISVSEGSSYEKSIYWRDSLKSITTLLFDQVQNKSLQKLQTEFEVAAMESRIKTLQLDNELESERAQRYRYTTIAMGIAILLLLGLIYFIRKTRVVRNEKEELKKENLKEKLEHKERELFTSTMLLIRKNEEMNHVKKQLEDISSDLKNNEIIRIIRNIDQGSRMEKDWEVFRMHFENANEGFLKRLAEKYGNLSASEVRLCTFIKMNMSNKEIAELNHVSLHAVEKSRSRLRKKIGLESGEDLFQWIQGV